MGFSPETKKCPYNFWYLLCYTLCPIVTKKKKKNRWENIIAHFFLEVVLMRKPRNGGLPTFIIKAVDYMQVEYGG